MLLAALLAAAAELAAPVATAAAPKTPHLVYALADDLGYGNVGWHRTNSSREVQTPELDKLVANGIELTSFYSFKYCSPTRSAFQSGRNPIHVNVVNGPNACHNPNDTISGYSGIPTQMTGIAEKLTSVGYRAHAVGKWHCGMATSKHTPIGRGYESWLGYYGACNDYWNEIDKCGAGTCHVDGTTTDMVDLWQQKKTVNQTTGETLIESSPALGKNNSRQCSQKNQHGCTFEDDALLAHAKGIIRSHAATHLVPAQGDGARLFLFWAMHACHGPREVPQATLNKFEFVDWNPRRTYAALANYMDTMVGGLVTELQQQGMWNDTLLVMSSDNGGDDQANNFPLRGAKFSNWQGGILVPAFVSGGYLTTRFPQRCGSRLNGLAAVWDLYATFGELAGLSEEDATSDPPAHAAGLPSVDSISQWKYWSGEGGVRGAGMARRAPVLPPRTELAVGAALHSDGGGGAGFVATTVEALISSRPAAGDSSSSLHHYKLMLGRFDKAMWTGPQYPNKSSTSFNANHSQWSVTADCTGGCLYDLSTPAGFTEHEDIASSEPGLVQQLKARLLQINATVFSPVRGKPDPLGCETAVKNYSGFWGPFL